ncbi:major facilitator superfamily transporter [Pelomyxa schiedti]|nr:major facilitator superfamily transporter [Pelomyxa schiedti]
MDSKEDGTNITTTEEISAVTVSVSVNVDSGGGGGKDTPPQKGEKEYKTYKRRWVMLVAFCQLRALHEVAWISFAPISSIVSVLFGVSISAVNTLSTVYMLTYIILSPLSAVMISQWGLRPALCLSAVLTALGGALRYAGALCSQFWVLWGGQLLMSCGQLFTLQSSTSLSACWFGSSERTKSTTIAYLSGVVGNLVAFLVGPVIVGDSGENFSWWMLSQGILCICAALFTIVLFKARPPSPPSAVSDLLFFSLQIEPQETAKKCLQVPSKADIKMAALTVLSLAWKLGTNLGFVSCLTAFGLVTGISWTVMTVLEQIVKAEGYTSFQSGVMGSVLVASGVIASFIASPIVDRLRCYKFAMIMCSIISLLPLLFCTCFLNSVNYATLIVLCGVMGVGMTAIGPLGLETAIEVTFPISEAVTSVALMFCAEGISFAFVFIATPMEDPSSGMRNFLIFLDVFLLVGLLACIAMPANYKRLKYEQEVLTHNPLSTP